MRHAVQLGLGPGGEFAGGVWTQCVSFAGLIGESLAQPVVYAWLLTGLSGLQTVVPGRGDVAGAVFGLGATTFFLVTGAPLVKEHRKAGI